MSASLSPVLDRSLSLSEGQRLNDNGPSMKPAVEYYETAFCRYNRPLSAAAVGHPGFAQCSESMLRGIDLSQQFGVQIASSADMVSRYLKCTNIEIARVGRLLPEAMLKVLKALEDAASETVTRRFSQMGTIAIGGTILHATPHLGESWPTALFERVSFGSAVQELKNLARDQTERDAIKPSKAIIENIERVGRNLPLPLSEPLVEWDDSTGTTTLLWEAPDGRSSLSLVFTAANSVLGVISDFDSQPPRPWKFQALEVPSIQAALRESFKIFSAQ